jgi:hypothetical protein
MIAITIHINGLETLLHNNVCPTPLLCTNYEISFKTYSDYEIEKKQL